MGPPKRHVLMGGGIFTGLPSETNKLFTLLCLPDTEFKWTLSKMR